jgi:S13-like H2TH domain
MPKVRGRAPSPVRSAEQRREALRLANEIRAARARLKKQLAAGSVRVEVILAAPPACAETQKLHDLLLAVPGYGPARVARLLARTRISHSKTVAGLSDRQRAELLDHFHAGAP